jgi:hypothetical protein
MVFADAFPEVVVAAGGDGVAVAVAEKSLGLAATSLFIVEDETAHEGWGDWLPSGCSAFLVKKDEALLGVEVAGSQAECAAAAAGGFRVESQEEGVEVRFVSGGCCGVDDLG